MAIINWSLEDGKSFIGKEDGITKFKISSKEGDEFIPQKGEMTLSYNDEELVFNGTQTELMKIAVLISENKNMIKLFMDKIVTNGGE